MSEFDRIFDAFLRNSIGFDYLPKFLARTGSSFPPYDLVKIDDNAFEVQVALAGYGPEDVEVKQIDNTLTISHRQLGEATEPDERIQYKGIAKRAFNLSFALGAEIEVESADFTNGLLIVGLKRLVPEKNEKLIPIGTGGALLEDKSNDGTVLEQDVESKTEVA